ncbi:COP9 signalosome complex subunit 3 [Cercospora beticola]|uniref:COP9 signalosome complex subunit 3 n=1 Tax=Cercospora beticola TaxID=122368 RepID=A0A2G5HT76_CERBT|nr:COP9 signalosome complex subunit 3 [Cercospora beticola]PIA95735.1 COP9 signalosome complex subunit 3 [Cercospora beticola]WPB07024.1 hypothetical protein RHO25_011684 [Cercospora beticola]CAK1366963.1 unnamed protein product [Cercospora beticola]
MGDVVPILLSFPPEKASTSPKVYDKAAREYIKSLDDIPDASFTKLVEKKNVLTFLDPAVNSIGYLRTLIKQIQGTRDKKQLDNLDELAVVFFGTFDPVQVRYVGEDFMLLWDWVYKGLQENGETDLTPLVNSLVRLDPTSATFIPAHLYILRLCLARSIPSLALPILDTDVAAFPSKSTKGVSEELPCDEHELSNAWITEKSGFAKDLKSTHVLEYYLLGASIYIGMHNWSRARLFLEYVLLSPSQSHTASALQVEAYKKWVLVGLIANGRPFSEPKTHDQVIWKALKSCSKMYDELATDFMQRNTRKFQADAETGVELIQDDGNFGLVKEVVDALKRFRVIDLQQTYAAIGVTRMASLLELDPGEALQLLQSMIQDGHLSASLSGAGADTVLRFHDAEPSNSQSDLEAQTFRIQALVAQIRDADRRLQLTKEYVDYQKRITRGLDGDPADAMDLTWDGPPGVPLAEGEDEDLML